MFGWIALIIILSFGAYSLHYFVFRTRGEYSNIQNAEATNLVTEMVRLWREENLSASDKLQRLNDTRERMIDFCDRREAAAPIRHEDNIAYLNAFTSGEVKNDRDRKSSGA